MENKITNIKDRVLQIAKYKGVPYERFCEEIGMTYGSFKGVAKERPLNSDAIEIIISRYVDINSEWLLTGKGNMLKDQAKEYIEKKEVSNIISEPNATYNNDEFKAKYYKKLEEENEWLKKIIAEKEELLDMYKTGKIVFVEPKKGALK